MNFLRRLGHWAIAPVVATGTTAGLVAGASAEPVTEVVDVSPAGGVSDALCVPLYGWGKEVGVPLIVEDANGDDLSSLEGYTFEIRAADGTTLAVPLGEGSGADDPVNISNMTATTPAEEFGMLDLFGPPIFFLNCVPPGKSDTPFAEGTTLVAMKDGRDVSSGSLAGRFPPMTLPLEVVDGIVGIAAAGLTSLGTCDADGVSAAYVALTEWLGLDPSVAIADQVAALYIAEHGDNCNYGEDLALAVSYQAAIYDGPRGRLPSTVIVPSSVSAASANWADYGFLPAVRLEAPDTDENVDEEDNDTLPNTGAALWILAIAGGAAGLAGVAARRRVALRP